MIDLAFTLDAKGKRTSLTLSIEHAVIAGWTGRDAVARDKHIADWKRSASRGRPRRRSIIASPRGG